MAILPRDSNGVPASGGVDTSTGEVLPLPIDHATGGLKINVGSLTATIGEVQQGAPNTIDQAWPVYPTTDGINKAGTLTHPIRVDPVGATTQPVSGTVNAVQSEDWNVGQSGSWTVGASQSGSWTVNAAQSGTWNVNQAGGWSVGQSGSWTVGISGTPTVQIGTSGLGSVGTPIRTDPVGLTPQPVSGTVAATQSGTWGVNPLDGAGNVQGTASYPTRINPVRSSSAAMSSVSVSTATAVLAASNAARKELIIFNQSSKTLYYAYAATASSSAFTDDLGPGQSACITTYTGVVSGIWSDVDGGAARITELS